MRAKRKLDEIALLTRPKIAIVHGGKERSVEIPAKYQGDVVVIRPGDQLVVDGPILSGTVEIDESPLTGEADPAKSQCVRRSCQPASVLATAMYEAIDIVNCSESYAYQTAETAARSRLRRRRSSTMRLLDSHTVAARHLSAYAALFASESSGIPFLRNVQVALMGLIPRSVCFLLQLFLTRLALSVFLTKAG